jgi:septum formation protein
VRPLRLVLASASPARLTTLRQAGLRPEVIVSGVDETQVRDLSPAAMAVRLATLKAEAVAERLGPPVGSGQTVVIGCDSILELAGRAYGKPGTRAMAIERWQLMRNNSGILHTGHHVLLIGNAGSTSRTAAAATVVHFADLSDAEIEAYVSTGEPLAVAGGFTIDGLGGPFVTGLEGDPSNVIGLSLPLLRTMLIQLGVSWPSLWAAAGW